MPNDVIDPLGVGKNVEELDNQSFVDGLQRWLSSDVGKETARRAKQYYLEGKMDAARAPSDTLEKTAVAIELGLEKAPHTLKKELGAGITLAGEGLQAIAEEGDQSKLSKNPGLKKAVQFAVRDNPALSNALNVVDYFRNSTGSPVLDAAKQIPGVGRVLGPVSDMLPAVRGYVSRLGATIEDFGDVVSDQAREAEEEYDAAMDMLNPGITGRIAHGATHGLVVTAPSFVGPFGTMSTAKRIAFIAKSPTLMQAAGMLGSMAVGGAQSGLGAYDEFVDRLMKEGHTEEEAKRMAKVPAWVNATSTAVLTALFGKTGIESALLEQIPAKSFKTALIRVLREGNWEGAEEAADNIIQGVYNKIALFPDTTAQEIMQETLAAYALGFALGGGTAAAGELAKNSRGNRAGLVAALQDQNLPREVKDKIILGLGVTAEDMNKVTNMPDDMEIRQLEDGSFAVFQVHPIEKTPIRNLGQLIPPSQEPPVIPTVEAARSRQNVREQGKPPVITGPTGEPSDFMLPEFMARQRNAAEAEAAPPGTEPPLIEGETALQTFERLNPNVRIGAEEGPPLPTPIGPPLPPAANQNEDQRQIPKKAPAPAVDVTEKKTVKESEAEIKGSNNIQERINRMQAAADRAANAENAPNEEDIDDSGLEAILDKEERRIIAMTRRNPGIDVAGLRSSRSFPVTQWTSKD